MKAKTGFEIHILYIENEFEAYIKWLIVRLSLQVYYS